jgi:hypothetical protein
LKNIEFESRNEFKKLLVNDIENMNHNKLRKDLNLSILGHDIGTFSLAKQGRAWTRHNAQLGIPIFTTNDARKWSVQDVASYVDQIVRSNSSNRTTNEQISISQRFIDEVINQLICIAI